MRKWLIFPLLMVLIFYISDKTSAHYSGVLLKQSDLYGSLNLTSGVLLRDMIILPESSYDRTEVSKIIQRIDQLPVSILKKANEQGIKLVLFNGKLTDNKTASHLKGEYPRGYSKSVVWDDLPGIGGSKFVLVKIGSSERGNGHGSVNLEYHELAHSLYNLVYNDKESITFIDSSWKNEATSIFPGISYFTHYKEEYFAECFALHFYSPDTRTLLKKKAPEMYQFLQGL